MKLKNFMNFDFDFIIISIISYNYNYLVNSKLY